MDLSKNANLTREEQLQIAADMHAMVVDELFRETKWLTEDAVFHGGTALTLGHKSLRFSEDLDFMVTEEAAASLEKALHLVQKRVNRLMTGYYPGGKVELKGPKGDEVAKWIFTWTHPNRRGTVKVNAEFLTTTKELLKAYRANNIVPTSKGLVELKAVVPIPLLISSWADKIKAIATRPVFKWRDAYDLSFVATNLDLNRDDTDEDRIVALESTASIYGKTLADVAEGLETVLASGTFEKFDEFEEDMARWFEADTYERYRAGGLFRNALIKAGKEVSKAVALCDMMRSGMKP